MMTKLYKHRYEHFQRMVLYNSDDVMCVIDVYMVVIVFIDVMM